MDKIFTSTKCLSPSTIQDYLKKELEEQRRYEVENHLLDCPLCSDAVEGLANHYNFDEDIQLSSLQKELKALSKDTQTKIKSTVKSERIKKLPQRRRRIPLSWVAAAILLLLIPLAGHFYWQENDGERIYQAFYESADYDAPLAQRANNVIDFTLPNMKKGMDYFNLKEYRESLGYYQEVLKENSENEAAIFFAGLASIELGKYEDAISYLSLSRVNHVAFYEASTWYLILIHLKQDNRTKAEELLDDLLNSTEDNYRQRALNLQAALKEEK